LHLCILTLRLARRGIFDRGEPMGQKREEPVALGKPQHRWASLSPPDARAKAV